MEDNGSKNSIKRVIRQLTTGFLLSTNEPIKYHNLCWTVNKVVKEKIKKENSILETLINSLK